MSPVSNHTVSAEVVSAEVVSAEVVSAEVVSADSQRTVSGKTSSNESAAQAERASALLSDLYGPVSEEMMRVEQRLRTEMRSPHPFVDELVKYGCMLGGKRLRPALVLLTAKACGTVKDEHITVATVLEMIHTATLVHDDVLDRAEQRRHLATVNARWDNEASILLGDFLFSHAFYLASTTDDAFTCRTIGQSTNRVCEGEIRQKGTRGNYDLSEQEYTEIIDAKTAELCACACHLGAYFSGVDEGVVEEMTHFGRELGIAFQIADDMLDLLGDEQTTGKSLGTDLDQRLMTLPTIHALHVATPSEREQLLAVLRDGQPDVQKQLFAAFQQHDSLGYTRSRATEFVTRARRRLDCLPASPAKAVLDRIAQFVIERGF